MKKFLSVIATLVLVLAVAGCTPRERKPDNEIIDYGDDYKNAISANITFWHAMGEYNQGVIAEIITEFNKQYPNIHVEQTSQGAYTDLRDKILKTLPSEDNPTIAQTYPDHVAAYMQGTAVRELDSYINHARYGIADQDDFVQAYFDEGTTYDVQGTLYSLPFNKSTEVMFYNKSWMKNFEIEGQNLYEKYGLGTKTVDGETVTWTDTPIEDAKLSWEDIVEISRYYVESSEYQDLSPEDQLVHAGFAADSEANLFITLTQQFGGQYTSLEEPNYLFDNQQSKNAIQWFKDLKEEGLFGTATKFGADYSSDAFINEQVKMTIGSSAGASYNDPGEGGFEVGILPYPQFEDVTQFGGIDPGYDQVIQQGTNVTLFKCSDAMEELAGWLFMRFLTGREAAMIWATKTGYFPIRKSVRSSDDYQDYLLGKKPIYDSETGEWINLYEPTFVAKTMQVGWMQKDLFYTSPAFPGSSDCRDQVEALFQSVLYTDITIDQAYQNALNELTSIE